MSERRQMFSSNWTYQTPKIVKVVDKKVGIIYYSICSIILCYVGFYVLMHQKQYQIREETVGGSAVKPVGTLVGQTDKGEQRVFDLGDYALSLEETSALFIATKVQITAGQKEEFCKNTKCTGDKQCPESSPLSSGKCLSNGYCSEYSWCPQNLDAKNTQNYTMMNLMDLHFNFFNVVQFNTEQEKPDKVYSTPVTNETILYPKKGANAISMGQLLIKTGLNVSQLTDKGAMIKVIFEYDCDLKHSQCEPKLLFDKLSEDEDPPISIESAYTYQIKGETYRDFLRYQGLRVVFKVKGSGFTLSITAIILQLSSAFALLTIAKVVTDLIMLYFPLLPKKHRQLYLHYKIENSEDFSDLQEKINLIEKEQEKRLKKLKRERAQDRKDE